MTHLNLATLETAQLEQLRSDIDAELVSRSADALEFTFAFEAKERTNGTAVRPYVARVTLDSNGKLDRHFKDLERFYGRREVRVEGEYTAKEGELLEIQFGGTSKNPHRYYYLVYHGEEVEVGFAKDTEIMSQVRKYLKGTMGVDNFAAIQKLQENAE